MEKAHVLALVITGVVGFTITIMSIFLIAGKASFLIAGYNTMSETEKAKYDGVALGRFLGKILLPIGIMCPGIAIAAILNYSWFPALFITLTLGICIFAAIYCNTGDRFKR